jgi:hypothetical protein
VAPAQVVAITLGIVLIAVGLLGLAFDTSWGTGDDLHRDTLIGLDVNGWHNIVHLASGLLLLAGAGSNARSRAVCRLFAVAYLVVFIAGLVDGDDVFGFMPINAGDNVLHGILVAIVLWAVALSKDRRDALARDRTIVAGGEDRPHVVGPGSGHVGGPRAIGPRIDRRLPVKKHP